MAPMDTRSTVMDEPGDAATPGLLARALGRLRRIGRSSLLRGLAGTTAGLPAGRSRRGTVLILVIGALALISVITLIYATIGQADRRSAQVVSQKNNIAGVADEVAQYLGGVIADGTFAVHVDGVAPGAGGGPILVRNAADYPATDPYRLSVAPPGSASLRDRAFNATGSYETAPAGADDPRRPATPFLAATAPGAMDYFAPPATPTHAKFRDWLHITNIAPSGQYVNLWNLAPVVNGARVSGFDARSEMPSPSAQGVVNNSAMAPSIVGGQVRSFMSHGLVLLDDAGNPTPNLPSGALANPNRPADWSSLQRGAYRPLTGPVFYPGFPAGNQPSHEYYAPYQWVDTDGDGIADARWCELVDITDPNSPVSLLPQDSRYRWFIAARVVDLASMVNLNSATDYRSANFAMSPLPGMNPAQAAPGTQVTKVGMYPSDNDVRRILVNDDPFWRFNITYSDIPQPLVPSLEDYSQYDLTASRTVGSSAYDALRIALRRDSAAVVPAGTDLPAYMTAMNPRLSPFYGDDRAWYYLRTGGHTTSGLLPSGGFEQSTRFGVDDLLELLTFHGINNPGVTSRLEQTVAGRDNSNPEFGPLRENRGLDVERGMLDANPQDGRLDDAAMALAATDVRRKITPISGARLLRSAIIPAGLRGILDPAYDGRIDLVEALQAATRSEPWAATNLRSPALLFEGVARGFLPHLRTGVWDPVSAPTLQTLHYGHSPERSVRHAAALVANNIDSYDEDGVPSAFTLLINQDARSAVAANTIDFPWWTQTGNGQPGRLDLGADRLARNSDPITAPAGAVNVYGIEAQPFITQVLNLTFYTDSPRLATEAPGDLITIRGNSNPLSRNPDYLGTVLAFQITNPFDERINLSRLPTSPGSRSTPIPSNNWTEYYLQYGENLIMLAEWRASTTGAPTLHEIWLDPHETRVVYCLSHPQDHRYASSGGTDTMEARFRDADPGLPPQPTLFLEGLIRNQLSVMVNSVSKPPILVPVMTKGPALGEHTPTPDTTWIDFQANTTTQERQNVYLWRNLHSSADQVNLASGTATTNHRGNDMLADRVREPVVTSAPRAAAVLDRRLPNGDQEIASTVAPNDDTGFSIVLWGSIRRPDDPGLTTAGGAPPDIPLGGIPAYCLEAKWNSATGTGYLNVKDAEPNLATGLSRSDFVSAQATRLGDETLFDLVTRLSNPLSTLTQTNIQKAPEDRFGDDIDTNGGGQPGNRDGRRFNDLYTQIPLNNKEFTSGTGSSALSTLRLTDILLPLGIGPSYEPPLRGGALPPPHRAPDPERCMALSEALALALNYSTPQSATGTPFAIFNNAGDPWTGTLDRGNLVLDNFAPYEDMTNPGVYDPPSILGAGGDKSRFPGIPLALNLLNVFRTLDPQFAGMTKAAPGLININTAVADVIRAVPLLSPTTERDAGSNQPIWQRWLAQAGLVAGVSAPVQPTAPGATDGTDIAATVVAARDKIVHPDRSGIPAGTVDFRDDPAGNVHGRRESTRIDALREAPGFGSVAELLTLTRRRIAGDPPNPPSVSRSFPVLNRIDYLGGDSQRSGAVGINTELYRDRTAPISAARTELDEIPDDYSEKLAIAGAVMNSVSVRSDIFAVWFVIHGYQRSDTEGLRMEDPLTPSVAKRYVMVVDRSNVTRMGEKPRILLFTEVPM